MLDSIYFQVAIQLENIIIWNF